MRSSSDESDLTPKDTFPSGFAQRFLVYAATAGPAWANIDLEHGEIDYVDEDRDPDISARIRINDEGLVAAWPSLLNEGRYFYRHLSDEEGAMVMLCVGIEEFVLTNYSPAPRYFTIQQIPL